MISKRGDQRRTAISKHGVCLEAMIARATFVDASESPNRSSEEEIVMAINLGFKATDGRAMGSKESTG